MYCPNCKDVNYPCPSCTYLKQEAKLDLGCPYCHVFKGMHSIGCKLGSQIDKETKMTRSEAIKNVMRKAPISYHNEVDTQGLLLALEALGLIKFDEEKIKITAESIIRNVLESNNLSGSQKAVTIINLLLKHNYRIVDAEVYEVVDRRQPGT